MSASAHIVTRLGVFETPATIHTTRVGGEPSEGALYRGQHHTL